MVDTGSNRKFYADGDNDDDDDDDARAEMCSVGIMLHNETGEHCTY